MKFSGYHSQWYLLSGNQSKFQPFVKNGTLVIKLDNLPDIVAIGGKVYIPHLAALKIHFKGGLVNTASAPTPASMIFQDDITPSLIKNVQMDGCEVGTPISSNHMVDGIIDVNEFLQCGLMFMGRKQYNTVLPVAGQTPLDHEVVLPIGNGLQHECQNTINPCCLYNKGQLVINLQDHFVINGIVDTTDIITALVAGTSISTIQVSVSALLVYKDEITVAPGYQMTRFKSTAAAGVAADTITLTSFGSNHTLAEADQVGGIFYLIWGSSRLRRAARGAGLVSSLSDFSADAFGIPQTQELRAYTTEQRNEILGFSPSRNVYFDASGIIPIDLKPSDAVRPFDTNFDIGGGTFSDKSDNDDGTQWFPIIKAQRNTMVTKTIRAAGSPSYNLTGNFSGDHYSYMLAAYAWNQSKLLTMIEVIKKAGIGSALYKDNDLVEMVKPSKKNASAINFSKAYLLPKKLLPRSFIAADTTTGK